MLAGTVNLCLRKTFVTRPPRTLTVAGQVLDSYLVSRIRQRGASAKNG